MNFIDLWCRQWLQSGIFCFWIYFDHEHPVQQSVAVGYQEKVPLCFLSGSKSRFLFATVPYKCFVAPQWIRALRRTSGASEIASVSSDHIRSLDLLALLFVPKDLPWLTSQQCTWLNDKRKSRNVGNRLYDYR